MMPDSSSVKIRRATLSQCDQLTDLCIRSKSMWGYDSDFMRQCRDELIVTESIIGRDLIRIAVRGDAVLGIVELSFESDEAEIEKLFVEPSSSGEGVGRLLMQWSIDAARKASMKRMVIVSDPNAAAFYRRIGAVDAGSAASASIPGRVLPRLIIDLTETV